MIGVRIVHYQVGDGPCSIGPEAGRDRSTAVSRNRNRHYRLMFVLILDNTIEWNMDGLASC